MIEKQRKQIFSWNIFYLGFFSFNTNAFIQTNKLKRNSHRMDLPPTKFSNTVLIEFLLNWTWNKNAFLSNTKNNTQNIDSQKNPTSFPLSFVNKWTEGLNSIVSKILIW